MPASYPLGESPRSARISAQDRAIPGLDRGRLHEVHAEGADRPGALAFALVAALAGTPVRPVFLIRSRGRGGSRVRLQGDGLARLGIDPARLTLVEPPAGRDGEAALLRAGLDAARCPALGAVVIESEGRLAAYDLTASRRLALAVERSGGRVVMVRIDAEPRPSAAFTRWTVASAPSVPLPGAAPGWPTLIARLDRRRGWTGGIAHWRLEWDSSHGFFRPLPQSDPAEGEAPPADAIPPAAPLPRAVAALAGLRGGPGHRAA